MEHEIKEIVEGYLEAALFAELDDHGDPLDYNYTGTDFNDSSLRLAEGDCERFIEILQNKTCDSIDSEFRNLYDAAVEINGERQLGMDLWLTRNHHGSGFWDGDYDNFGDHLAHIVSESFPELCIVEFEGELLFE